jgi:hypothetical protein
MRRALINATLGDGFFWKHPESKNWNLIWNSIHKDWLIWKQRNLLPATVKSRIQVQRRAGASGCFENSKTLYSLKTHASEDIWMGHGMTQADALEQADLMDLAVWYIDDGCAVRRRDTRSSYRIYLCVGPLTANDLFPHMERILGLPKKSLGRVFRNNSKASERNKSWIIPKAAAVQILRAARDIAPECLQYKAPLW